MAVMTLRDVSDKLRNDFKAVCAKKGVTMKDEILRFMKEEVEKAAQKD